MSKYRITIKPAKYHEYFILAFYALCVLSVILWQPGIFRWQLSLQILFTIVLMAGGYYSWLQYRRRRKSRIVMLSDVGQWLYLDDESQAYWQVTRHSRISKLLLWVNLLPELRSPSVSGNWLWIFKDQVSEQDYRRLCRIIIRQQNESSGSAEPPL